MTRFLLFSAEVQARIRVTKRYCVGMTWFLLFSASAAAKNNVNITTNVAYPYLKRYIKVGKQLFSQQSCYQSTDDQSGR